MHAQRWLAGQLLCGLVLAEQTPIVSESRPNVVFILTDDQDLRMNSLAYMPNLQKHLVQEGTFFERHYATIALCCPSRVSLWTGRAAHNTNVTDVVPPYGGYPKFVSQGFNEAWLPLWLQEAGINTYYVGKLFNAHNTDNWNDPHPSGFNGSDFSLDPFTYQYLNITTQRNDESPVSHEGEYATDVLAGKAYGFLDDAIEAGRPFHLTIATNAPHSNVEFKEEFFHNNVTPGNIKAGPPIPAPRHAHLFPDVVVPRTPNFNPDHPTGVSWISKLPQQNQTVVDANDHFYRNRLRALQAVDEIIEEVVKKLDDAEILDNTYIFYSADNGYHIGQHRMNPGKECGFEEDINVPLIVRGPGVPKGHVSQTVTTHTDLAPTFINLAGGKLRDDFDGSPIDLHSSSIALSHRSEHVNVEYWGWALTEGIYDHKVFKNNTYKSLRLVGNDYNFYYSVWCSGEHQLYDLNTDPFEIDNLFDSRKHSDTFHFTSTVSNLKHRTGRSTSYKHLLARLDTLLLVLKSCKARACTHPWEVLHPDGDVTDLHAALATKFDHFYEIEQERVSFTKCEDGYILESEGPIDAKSYGQIRPRGGAQWHELV